MKIIVNSRQIVYSRRKMTSLLDWMAQEVLGRINTLASIERRNKSLKC